MAVHSHRPPLPSIFFHKRMAKKRLEALNKQPKKTHKRLAWLGHVPGFARLWEHYDLWREEESERYLTWVLEAYAVPAWFYHHHRQEHEQATSDFERVGIERLTEQESMHPSLRKPSARTLFIAMALAKLSPDYLQVLTPENKQRLADFQQAVHDCMEALVMQENNDTSVCESSRYLMQQWMMLRPALNASDIASFDHLVHTFTSSISFNASDEIYDFQLSADAVDSIGLFNEALVDPTQLSQGDLDEDSLTLTDNNSTIDGNSDGLFQGESSSGGLGR